MRTSETLHLKIPMKWRKRQMRKEKGHMGDFLAK
jgi:hypothetical protein